MNIQKISAINYSAAGFNLKSKNRVQNNEQNSTSLSSPAEMCGRSQVAFAGIKRLSDNDLNFIAKTTSICGIKPEQISPLKDVLKDFLNKHNLKNLSDVGKKLDEDDIVWELIDIENGLKSRCKMTDKAIDSFTTVLSSYFDGPSNGNAYVDYLRRNMK